MNGRSEAERLGLLARPHAIVGTVPVQHSYGFESTFLLALHAGCPFWSGRPFYPQDIADALGAASRGRACWSLRPCTLLRCSPPASTFRR